MKLHILSDLHVEFGDFSLPDVGADLVVLAGDTHIGQRGVNWVLDQDLQAPVLYVLGNHEFYRGMFPGLIDALRQAAHGTNIHVLENGSIETGGFRFFGGTLWSDMDLFKNPSAAMATAANGMNDYHMIRNSQTSRRLTPPETVARHRQSVGKLREFLESGDAENSVVVTHSCPTIQSIPRRFRGHALVPSFASNMEDLIRQYQPRLWIHGHTHDSCDYHIGRTRIVCNPRGYVPHAKNPEFEAEFSIELSPASPPWK